MASHLNRREILALGTAGAAALAVPGLARAALSELTLYGPPAGPSIILANAAMGGGLSEVASKTGFKAWRNPDELRAGLTSKTIQVSVMPVQAVANLYNRGFPVKLVNVMTQGLLHVVTTDPAISDIASLAGKRIVVPFRGDTPDIILNRLLTHAGLDKDGAVKVMNIGTPIEAVQMLLTGRADAALLPEPACSAVIMKGKKMGKAVRRVIDIQTEWGALTKSDPIVPQAGLAVTGPFLKANEGLVPVLNAALARTAEQVKADPKKAAMVAAGALKMPPPILAASIPHSRLGVWSARSMREPVERMLKVMAGPDMKKIGGKLPDDGFYL